MQNTLMRRTMAVGKGSAKHLTASVLKAALGGVLVFTVACTNTQEDGAGKNGQAAPTKGIAFSIDLQEGFAGSEVVVNVDHKQVYRGKPSTNPLLGLAKGIPTSAVSNTPVLNVAMPDQEISWTETVDLSKGVGVGISLVNGKITMRQAQAFGYD